MELFLHYRETAQVFRTDIDYVPSENNVSSPAQLWGQCGSMREGSEEEKMNSRTKHTVAEVGEKEFYDKSSLGSSWQQRKRRRK